MQTLRRFLVLAALSFWLGGFTFYTAVVVPIGTDELGSTADQGAITRRVTNYINLSGAAALAPLALDLLAGGDPSKRRRGLRVLFWLGLLLTLLVLFYLHLQLDALLDETPYNRSEFLKFHRLYLWVSTLQWAFGLGFLLLTLPAWRAEDQRSPERATEADRRTSGA
jgi:Na+-driven multidrug efflux pump